MIFDVVIASMDSRRPRVLQSIFCWLGMHEWGYCHCPCCGKRDAILCTAVDAEWEQLGPVARNNIRQHAINLIQGAQQDD